MLSCSYWLLQGGESKGLARLTKSLEDKDWVVQFEKPKGNPAALEPATTVLSPYMKFGCVSCRLFYAKLVQASALVMQCAGCANGMGMLAMPVAAQSASCLLRSSQLSEICAVSQEN